MNIHFKLPPEDKDEDQYLYNVGIIETITMLVTLVLIVVLFATIGSCTTYKCYPSPKSKDYARLIKVEKVKDSCHLTWRRGFKYFSTICPCDSFKVGKYYDI